MVEICSSLPNKEDISYRENSPVNTIKLMKATSEHEFKKLWSDKQVHSFSLSATHIQSY